MKIGMRTHDFGRMEVPMLAKTIKDAGFDCVQIAPTKAVTGIDSFDKVTDSLLKDILAEFTKNDVELTVLGCYIEPSIPDSEQRLKNVKTFQQGILNAKKLGINIVGTETTHLDISASESAREEAYQRLKDSVLRMAETAEKEDVCIGIEPVAEHTLNTPALARRLLDEVKSDKLKIIFDPVNLVLPSTIDSQREIFQNMFDLLGSEIVAVHVKDIVIENNEKTWRNIGKGVIDYNFLIKWLKANKPEIRLLREGVKRESYEEDRAVMIKFLD